MNTPKLIVTVCLVIGLSGCANMSDTGRRTATGAGIGAVGGALISSLTVGKAGVGALVGAAAGAGGGYLYDRHEKAQGN